MIEATKRRTGRRSVGRAIQVWLSVDRVGERAYFIMINWMDCEQEMELDTDNARDQQEARPLMEDLAQERLAGTGRAHSRLGYRRLATFLITSQLRESL